MRVGIPTEAKNNEFRVSMTPSGVSALVHGGHEVLVQAGAGVGSAVSDEDYAAVGATIVDGADEVWAQSDMIVKVKEPIESEYGHIREGQIVFTYLHLAADKPGTDALLGAKAVGIAYETVRLPDGRLPLLIPMSEIAGRLAPQVGSYFLQKPHGGKGVLMGGVTGVEDAHVLVIGGGTAGINAAAGAVGLGADVTVVDNNIDKLRQITNHWEGRVCTRYSTPLEISRLIKKSDVVVGSVLIPGSKAPKLVTNEMVASMQPGSVLVDIAIDQGGCFEDSHPTTHEEPTFRVHDTTFYCVTNMPGTVPVSSTQALTNATLPYIHAIADKGWKKALADDVALRQGLNTFDGKITFPGVAEAFDMECASAEEIVGA